MDTTDRELMSEADVGRTVSRIAHQIIEKTALDGADAPRVVLLGIPTRGVTLAGRLAAGEGEPLDAAALRAPLPRSWQWLDGSAFHNHGELMQIAFNLPPIDGDRPLMYQGLSDRFYGPTDPVPFPDPADGIDFEGEFSKFIDAQILFGLSFSAQHSLDSRKENSWGKGFGDVVIRTEFKPQNDIEFFAFGR